jgi:hypothetical protein
MSMDALVAFLTARLDEDEQVALAAKQDLSGRWAFAQTLGGRSKVTDDLGYSISETDDVDSQPWAAQPHIARWDPARVLAEVEAKQRLLRQATAASQMQELAPGLAADAAHDAFLTVLELLAEVYADHQDYREEWRP